MGEVTVPVKLTNLIDIERQAAGEAVTPRTVEVEAVVDTGAVRSVIPERIARALGLRIIESAPVRVAGGGEIPARRVRGLVIQILGREVEEDALVLGEEVLVGQTTLESTSLVVDCANQAVYPDPRNPSGLLKVR
jgi:clan AA aspartic protease